MHHFSSIAGLLNINPQFVFLTFSSQLEKFWCEIRILLIHNKLRPLGGRLREGCTRAPVRRGKALGRTALPANFFYVQGKGWFALWWRVLSICNIHVFLWRRISKGWIVLRSTAPLLEPLRLQPPLFLPADSQETIGKVFFFPLLFFAGLHCPWPLCCGFLNLIRQFLNRL